MKKYTVLYEADGGRSPSIIIPAKEYTDVDDLLRESLPYNEFAEYLMVYEQEEGGSLVPIWPRWADVEEEAVRLEIEFETEP